ncbi:PKD domain-containing protein [Pedobacter sp. N36a]|uniref:PKD domain-containing protein n=1 Tax=Pedobacter sp. N36a TaxID=2767996 RepID=UPI001656FF78|nr:PKD domain-containing protein [Pedobacter sp. N36a]MBC8985534.1 PKD domain-containing protein [Pedobacter sp. N36a]
MTKRCLVMTILILFATFLNSYSQITIGTVDPGPYTPGSSIAVTFKIADGTCLKPGNVFELYLSDGAGSFSGNNRIGTYTGFYSTFVNGTIPPTGILPGLGYRLQIRSSQPAFTTTSDPFEIKAGTPVKAAVTSSPIRGTTDEVFGYCPGRANVSFDFSNASSPNTSTVSGTIKNEISGTSEPNLVFNTASPDPSLTAGLAHYTVLIKAVANGTIGTRAYMIVNNTINNSFGTTGDNTVCLPGGYLEFPVDLSDRGIKNNYPGTIYQINWGDSNGIPVNYTICDLSSGYVRHEYTTSSCGAPIYNPGTGPKYNVFAINIAAIGPFCTVTGGELSTYVRVLTKPINSFDGPPVGCVGKTVTFINTSTPGQNEANTPSCTDNSVTYNWYIDGVKIKTNYTKEMPFSHIFPTAKNYIIKLESVSDGRCVAEVATQEICIQNPPKPDFDFNGVLVPHCAPYVIQANDKSILDPSCNTNHVYNWIVKKQGRNALNTEVTYMNGLTEPVFTFLKKGEYEITLEISTPACGAVSSPAPQTVVIIDSTPKITLAQTVDVCAIRSFKYNDVIAGPTNVKFEGTERDEADTYTWTVTGLNDEPLTSDDYVFVNGTGITKYPEIDFKKYRGYKVSVAHKNSCGTVTSVQNITFHPSPVIQLTANKNSICAIESVDLTAEITGGTHTTTTWTGAGNISSPTNSLTTNYIPTPQERTLGKATITFLVNTGLDGLCAQVKEDIIIDIFKQNSGTNATQTICSGNNANYDPGTGTSLPGSTFKWTAINPDGNAVNYTVSGSGPINDQLSNNHATANATVIYEITPVRDGCDGFPFTYTVTIYPKPAGSANAVATTICSAQETQITLLPTIPNTQYTWSSTATNGVTGKSEQVTATGNTFINDILINDGTSQGSVTYNITPLYNNCPGDIFSITINVDPAITKAEAGVDESICATNTYILSGNPTTKPGEIGTWTLSSGPNAISFDGEEHTPTATAKGLVAGGPYIFKWTITGPGACVESSDLVTIHVNEPTVAGMINGGTTVCSGTNTGRINLTGNTGSILEWKSSIDNGSTWQTATGNNTTANLTYNNLTTTTQYYAVVKNGSCAELNTNIITIYVAPPTTLANAGPDQELCEATSASLKANQPVNGDSGRWEYVTGPAAPVFANATDPETIVTELQIGGTYVFKWTITGNAPCDPTEDLVIIKSLKPIDQYISNPRPVICYDQTVNIEGSLPTDGNGIYTYIWESKTPTGSWTTIPNQTGQNLQLVLQASISFRRIVNSGSCTKTSNETEIIVQDRISNNEISPDQSICNNTAPTLITGTTPEGADGNFFYIWQSSTDGGTTWTDVNSFGINYQPPVLTATTAYRRIVYTTICDGAQRSISALVTITVKPDATALFTFTNQTGCAPFLINSDNIKAIEHPLVNDTYTWFINDVPYHTGPIFKDYTINGNDQSITIKLVVTSKVGCNSAEFIRVFNTRPAVPASFTQSDTEICGPMTVRFVNASVQSAGATFLWDFGNGQTSTEANPAPVNFNPDPTGKDITYTITLTSTTPCGSNTYTSTLLVKATPIAVFSPSKTVGCSPMLVNFTNTSPGGTNTYTYDFGDGSDPITRSDKLPVSHTYNTTITKVFTVTMTAVNGCGTHTKTYNIQVSPQNITPELVVDANEKKGCAPLTVNFDNNSIGATHFTFDFGDGGTMNTTEPGRVQHIFTKPGKYTITMTAFNNCSEITEIEEVEVLEQPLAAFNADQTLGCAGLAVQFRNTTQNGFSYVWDFGDGTTSNEFEPNHIYNGDQEYYTVTLTATNTLGCSISVIRNQYIHIVPPPKAAFNVNPSTLISIPNYTFSFEDESTNSPTIWAWDFGDGTTSAKQHPIHTYPDTGTYKVTLTTFNQQGCSTSTFKHVTIKGVPGYLFVPNSFIPGSEYPELRTFIAKGSGIATWKFSVFNKWGELLWETTKLDEGRPAEGWDGNYKGNPAPQGVYFWKIDVKMVNGTEWKGMTYDKSVPKRTGAIHLIR